MNRTIKKKIRIFLTYATLIFVTFITLFPLLWGVSASLRDDMEFYKYVTPFNFHTIIPVELSFDAYRLIFQEFNFMQPIVNTLIVAGISILAGCLINSIAAFAFTMFDFKFKSILFGLVMLSFMIPFESIALPLYQIADKLNLVDTRAGIVLPGIASGLVLFLFVQFFKDIPVSLLEAARVDGATIPIIFGRIIMPLSKPVFITAGLMIFMDQWNSYLWPLLIARSKDIRTIQISLSTFQMERSTLWSLLYAGSIISALIPLFLFLPFQKYFVEGITSGGVKG